MLVCSFSPDGRTIVAGASDCHVYAWRWDVPPATGVHARRSPGADPAGAGGPRAAPPGRHADAGAGAAVGGAAAGSADVAGAPGGAAAGARPPAADAAALAAECPAPVALRQLSGHRHDVLLLLFSHDGGGFATGSRDGTVRVRAQLLPERGSDAGGTLLSSAPACGNELARGLAEGKPEALLPLVPPRAAGTDRACPVTSQDFFALKQNWDTHTADSSAACKHGLGIVRARPAQDLVTAAKWDEPEVDPPRSHASSKQACMSKLPTCVMQPLLHRNPGSLHMRRCGGRRARMRGVPAATAGPGRSRGWPRARPCRTRTRRARGGGGARRQTPPSARWPGRWTTRTCAPAPSPQRAAPRPAHAALKRPWSWRAPWSELEGRLAANTGGRLSGPAPDARRGAAVQVMATVTDGRVLVCDAASGALRHCLAEHKLEVAHCFSYPPPRPLSFPLLSSLQATMPAQCSAVYASSGRPRYAARGRCRGGHASAHADERPAAPGAHH